jgi:hypothetical protein
MSVLNQCVFAGHEKGAPGLSLRKRVLFALSAVIAVSASARAEEDHGRSGFDRGHWRLELAGAPQASGNPIDRDEDYYLMGSAEYEFEVFRRSTLALRLMPLFYYDEDKDEGGGEGPIFGAGVGLKYRMYATSETRAGLFIELGISAIGHESQFEGNSKHFNFLSEGGIGYQFQTVPWNLGVRYTHISNAALGDENKEVAGIAIALGYRF